MCRFRSFFYMMCCLLLLGSLCGCALILERDFIFEEEHISADDEDEETTGVLELTSYDELWEALLTLIENHSFVQTVRLTDYTGDVERDVQQIVRDAMATPLGSFAVTNIAYQSSRILSYYEIRFDISYRRTAQEIDEIEQIEDVSELELYISEKMSQFSTSIIFKLDDYTQSKYDFEDLYMSLYYDNPQIAYGFESIEAHFYPESGVERIVELTVGYSQQPATLSAKSATATDEAQIILDSYIGSQLTANRLKYFHDTICASVEFDTETAQTLQESDKTLPKTDPFTVYGALIKKEAVGEGFALAFKQLCDMSGIDCMVVSGKLDGAPHMWNLVLNRGEWSHVDCSADTVGGGTVVYDAFGRTDEEMAAHYTWDRNAYPESTSSILRDMLSLTESSIETAEYGDQMQGFERGVDSDTEDDRLEDGSTFDGVSEEDTREDEGRSDVQNS